LKPPDNGLQAERTSLAWSRTSFAGLVNGVLLIVREIDQFTGPLQLLPSLMAIAVSIVVYGIGRQRQRALRERPVNAVVIAHSHVRGIAAAVLLLILVTALALLA
jgi:uncharacterized membrane protein YidH (DUF202 family)